jgi:flagellar basal body rod protein FlgC
MGMFDAIGIAGTGLTVHRKWLDAISDNGYVRLPDIDLGTQMADLIMAQRGYQANAAVVDRAKDSYQAALEIGRN